jgi:two-component system chemotaxis response regulator CheB
VIRVLVAEDSSTARALLVSILNDDAGRFNVVGEAKNGIEALALTRLLRPDVVTMDIQMPLLDGVEATRRIMIEVPTPVVVVSGSDVLQVETSMNALRAGALAVIEKPAGLGHPAFDEQRRMLLDTVGLMAGVKVVRQFDRQERPAVPARPPINEGARSRFNAVAIATSTGGPAALSAILSKLPAEFPIPILVVQHIAHGFVGGLATWLDSSSGLRVKIAEADEVLASGTAYLAPDDRHLGVTAAGRVLLSSAPAAGGFRPSGTFLFESVAKVFGPATLALILTGMGRDGLEGLRRVKDLGGSVIAQDAASSVVFGMPAAAIEAGLADEIVGLDELAARILQLVPV